MMGHKMFLCRNIANSPVTPSYLEHLRLIIIFISELLTAKELKN